MLDFLCEKKSISSIKTELIPYLVYKQFSRAYVPVTLSIALGKKRYHGVDPR